jgi:hypothetical protein
VAGKEDEVAVGAKHGAVAWVDDVGGDLCQQKVECWEQEAVAVEQEQVGRQEQEAATGAWEDGNDQVGENNGGELCLFLDVLVVQSL